MRRCGLVTRLTAIFTALAFSISLLGLLPAARAAGKIQVMTATTDLGYHGPGVAGPGNWRRQNKRRVDRARLPGPALRRCQA